jgi:hypothetical protein
MNRLFISKKIMLRIALILCVTMLYVSEANSQKTVDVLYLRNGSIIRGTITDDKEEIVKIETCCGSLLIFQKSDIEKTEQEVKIRKSNSVKEKGYLNFTSFGVILGSSSNEKRAPFSALMEHNYKFNQYFAAGGVIGVEMLNETVFPVAVNLKFILPLQTGNLFLGTSAGYSFSTEKPMSYDYGSNIIKSASGGIMANAELGYVLPVTENTAIFAAIGYRYNELNYKLQDWWIRDSTRTIYYNRVSIRLGISFY